MTAGERFRRVLKEENPLQIVGAVNAYSAIQAKKQGFKALYLSGSGVAAASYGLPDLGITTWDNVLEDARRIIAAVDLPLLVDADTGFGAAFNIARTVKDSIRAGVAGIHIEDQVATKRCGHRPNKALVSTEEMVDRIQVAASARTDLSFILMARTDAIANEGLGAAIKRAKAYIEAGADMIFMEALETLEDYEAVRRELKVPLLVNMTEFGKTPLCSLEDLRLAGVDMVLYPLSAFRAMSKAAEEVYQAIREKGSQESVLSLMQTREELYETLDYYRFEKQLDQWLNQEKKDGK